MTFLLAFDVILKPFFDVERFGDALLTLLDDTVADCPSPVEQMDENIDDVHIIESEDLVLQFIEEHSWP